MKAHLYKRAELTVKQAQMKIQDLTEKLNNHFTDLKSYVEYVKLVKESEQAVVHFTEQQKTANMMNTAIKKNKGQG